MANVAIRFSTDTRGQIAQAAWMWQTTNPQCRHDAKTRIPMHMPLPFLGSADPARVTHTVQIRIAAKHLASQTSSDRTHQNQSFPPR